MNDFAIETNGLTRYFGDVTAVDRLALRVERGSVYGFLGPNGAGKTTTIRMLLGLLRSNAGEVEILGRPLRRQRRACLSRVGALVEAPSLYPHLSGRENLEVTRRLLGVAPRDIDRVLEIVQLARDADRPIKTYSLGMKQRLALALALLGRPDLLILDEPTNGLDPAGIREIRHLLRRLPDEQGITVFVSSHLLAEVEQIATHIGIVRKGRLCFQGALADLHAEMEDHVVLGVDRPEEADRILRRAGWTARSSGNGHVWVAINGRADAAMVNAQLVREGLNVYHLDVETTTLEDIFLTLTSAKAASTPRARS
jgi:ABC-2 type transport system ATP-binding protein